MKAEQTTNQAVEFFNRVWERIQPKSKMRANAKEPEIPVNPLRSDHILRSAYGSPPNELLSPRPVTAPAATPTLNPEKIIPARISPVVKLDYVKPFTVSTNPKFRVMTRDPPVSTPEDSKPVTELPKTRDQSLPPKPRTDAEQPLPSNYMWNVWEEAEMLATTRAGKPHILPLSPRVVPGSQWTHNGHFNGLPEARVWPGQPVNPYQSWYQSLPRSRPYPYAYDARPPDANLQSTSYRNSFATVYNSQRPTRQETQDSIGEVTRDTTDSGTEAYSANSDRKHVTTDSGALENRGKGGTLLKNRVTTTTHQHIPPENLESYGLPEPPWDLPAVGYTYDCFPNHYNTVYMMPPETYNGGNQIPLPNNRRRRRSQGRNCHHCRHSLNQNSSSIDRRRVCNRFKQQQDWQSAEADDMQPAGYPSRDYTTTDFENINQNGFNGRKCMYNNQFPTTPMTPATQPFGAQLAVDRHEDEVIYRATDQAQANCPIMTRPVYQINTKQAYASDEPETQSGTLIANSAEGGAPTLPRDENYAPNYANQPSYEETARPGDYDEAEKQNCRFTSEAVRQMNRNFIQTMNTRLENSVTSPKLKYMQNVNSKTTTPSGYTPTRKVAETGPSVRDRINHFSRLSMESGKQMDDNHAAVEISDTEEIDDIAMASGNISSMDETEFRQTS